MQIAYRVQNPDNFNIDTVAHNVCGDNVTPMSLRANVSLDGGESALIDLSHIAEVVGFENVQCIFCDTLDNDGDLLIRVEDTDQRILCKAGRQGYYPILAPRKSRFRVKYNGTEKIDVRILFLNFTIAQGDW